MRKYTLHYNFDAEADPHALAKAERIIELAGLPLDGVIVTDAADWAEHVATHCQWEDGSPHGGDLATAGVGRRLCAEHRAEYYRRGYYGERSVTPWSRSS